MSRALDENIRRAHGTCIATPCDQTPKVRGAADGSTALVGDLQHRAAGLAVYGVGIVAH